MKHKAFKSLRHLRPVGKGPIRGLFSLEDFPGFSTRDLKALELYYASQLVRHDAPERKVGWQTAESQRVRFEALAIVGPLENTRILDVGCGLGAFFAYLKEKKLKVDYTGVDLFPGVIREAKQLYPEGKFQVRNILARPFSPRTFDFSFLSGVFNIKIQDNWKYMRQILTAVLRQTRMAVAFNALNSEAGIRESNRFTVNSRELVGFGRRLGVSRVLLMDHYHPLDLTLFLYK